MIITVNHQLRQVKSRLYCFCSSGIFPFFYSCIDLMRTRSKTGKSERICRCIQSDCSISLIFFWISLNLLTDQLIHPCYHQNLMQTCLCSFGSQQSFTYDIYSLAKPFLGRQRKKTFSVNFHFQLDPRFSNTLTPEVDLCLSLLKVQKVRFEVASPALLFGTGLYFLSILLRSWVQIIPSDPLFRSSNYGIEMRSIFGYGKVRGRLKDKRLQLAVSMYVLIHSIIERVNVGWSSDKGLG